MTDSDKCDLILAKMSQIGGYDVVDSADGWSDEECDYFLANYESAWLKPGETSNE